MVFTQHVSLKWLLACWLTTSCLAGCAPPQGGNGQGPGGRYQVLALTPEQEVALGRKAYAEILAKAGNRVEPKESVHVQRVQRIGLRIAETTRIEPLMREVNLRVRDFHFDWEFHVIRSDQVNAFCLPGGKVAVFTGILPVAENDDQLATVMAHEIAHALAHHASERIARAEKQQQAQEALSGAVGPELAGILAAGAGISGLKYDRQQESEADHIGVFLMTFAGYDPDEAVRFWERMERRASGGNVPEVLSDHPSGETRIAQLRKWAPMAKGGKRAYDEGRIDTQRRR